MFGFSWLRRKKGTTPAQDSTVPSPPPSSIQEGDKPAADRPVERGWLISSVDLHAGLQVTEREDDTTIPSELDRLPPAGEPPPRR